MNRLIGRLRCIFGKHERSPDRARRLGSSDHMTSECTYCGVRMWRLGKRDWIVDTGQSAEWEEKRDL